MECVKLIDPPVGIVQAKVEGETSFIEWAPGNGLVYRLLVTHVSEDIKKLIGGNVLLSLCSSDGQTFVTYPGNPSGLYHVSFVNEKWGKGEHDEWVSYVTALLNWARFESDTAKKYAREVFEEVKNRYL